MSNSRETKVHIYNLDEKFNLIIADYEEFEFEKSLEETINTYIENNVNGMRSWLTDQKDNDNISIYIKDLENLMLRCRIYDLQKATTHMPRKYKTIL